MKPILHILTRVSTSIQKEEGYGLDVQLSEGKSVAEMLGFDFRHWEEGAGNPPGRYRCDRGSACRGACPANSRQAAPAADPLYG